MINQTFCVAAAIIEKDGKYFIAKRSTHKKIMPGLWEFVTGFVEDHESAEETVLRELKEEVNANGTIIKTLETIVEQSGDVRWIVIPFIVSASPEQIKLSPKEHAAGAWLTRDELIRFPQNQFRYDLRLIDRSLSGVQTHNLG